MTLRRFSGRSLLLIALIVDSITDAGLLFCVMGGLLGCCELCFAFEEPDVVTERS